MILDPTDARRVDVADVYKGDALAGTLRRVTTGVAFSYTTAYLELGGPAVASTIPLSATPVLTAGGAVPAFFAGLLPEGARLQAVIDAVKTSPDDELSLLLAVGSDTIGDVRVVPTGERPEAAKPLVVDDPSEVSFRNLFERTLDPRGNLDRAIPGVQDKLSDAIVSFPVRPHEGPSILKLSPGRFPLLVENEAFFLSMARACGFRVPEFRVVRDRDLEAGLLVRRFDRELRDGTLVRFAQEDACQLAARWPADKYRMSMREVMEVVGAVASSPRAAHLELVRLVAFSLAIANGDLHAKNMSVRWLPETESVELTPTYDLVSTRPYPVDHRLALQVDGRDNRLNGSQLIAFAERFGLPERLVRRRLDDLCDRAAPFVDQVQTIGFDERLTSQLADTLRARIDELRR